MFNVPSRLDVPKRSVLDGSMSYIQDICVIPSSCPTALHITSLREVLSIFHTIISPITIKLIYANLKRFISVYRHTSRTQLNFAKWDGIANRRRTSGSLPFLWVYLLKRHHYKTILCLILMRHFLWYLYDSYFVRE